MTIEPAARVRAALDETFGPSEAPVYVARAPGRVNLIGDHTDYNDGFVFPMTIDRAVYVALRRRADRTVRLRSVEFDDELRYELDARPEVEPGSWGSYVTGVVEELRRRGGVEAGLEAVVHGDVPVGSGLSSSAALEVAAAVGLEALFGLRLEPVDAARLCQRVEHVYAGVQCGIMDQFASRLGRRGHALLLDCRSLAYEHVPVDLARAALVLTNSRAPRSLASSRYNERRAECETGVAFFREADPSIEALRDVSPALLDAHEGDLPGDVFRRCRHVVSENARVLAAREALGAGDFARVGALMTASHASLRDDYEVSSPPLDLLVDTALATAGVFGARLTGAGFGGCTVTLVEHEAVGDLEARLVEVYTAAFGRAPVVHVLEDNLEAGLVESP